MHAWSADCGDEATVEARTRCYALQYCAQLHDPTGRTECERDLTPAETASAARPIAMDETQPSESEGARQENDPVAPDQRATPVMRMTQSASHESASVEPPPTNKSGKKFRLEDAVTITRLARISHNRYLVALDNGQLWEQTDAAQVRIKPGYRGRISRSTLGAEKLILDRGGRIKVRRIRCEQSDADDVTRSKCGSMGL